MSGYRPHLRTRSLNRQGFADLGGRAELKLLSGMPVALSGSRRQDFHSFQNADVRGVLDLRAAGGWLLEVVVRATFLATHPLADALALADRIALGFGDVLESRLRRFDMAADFVGWPLRGDDAERFSTRGGKASFFVDSKDLDEIETPLVRPVIREFSRNGVGVTGHSIASGNPLSGRAYRKDHELKLAGREAKRKIEFKLWEANGWQGEPVTRLEFQHRGVFLDEIRLRDPKALESRLGAVWSYDTGRFLRMRVPGTASRPERWAEDPRWLAARFAFGHVVSPVVRTRALRGGASASQVVGATLSHAAAAGTLQRAQISETVVSGDCLIAALDEALQSPDRYERVLAEVLRRTVPANERASAEYAARLLQIHGPDALRLFHERVDGLVARFWSTDDESPALPATATPANGSSGK